MCLLFKSPSKTIPATFKLTESGLEISHRKSGFGESFFHAQIVRDSMEIEDDIGLGGEGLHLDLKHPNTIEMVLNSMRKLKVEFADVGYNSKEQCLQITAKNTHDLEFFNFNWSIKVNCRRPRPIQNFYYSYKRLRLALGIFPKDSPIEIIIFPNGAMDMKTNYDHDGQDNAKKREVHIRISALID